MKTIMSKFAVLLFVLLAFNSCSDKCFYFEDQTVYEPVLQPLSDIKNSFAIKEDYTIGKPGNIYSYGKYLLVGEKREGIHILDNTNPSNPIPLKFIQLKGNTNFAIVNNVILADNGPDLVSIDFSDLNNITLENREENVNTQNVQGDQFIVDYNPVVKKIKVDCESSGNNGGIMRQSSDASFSGESGGISTGKGGSMSKFAVIDNFLYIVNSSELLPFDVSAPKKPVKHLKMGLNNSNVETLFPYNSYLYMGTSNGVLIYNTATSKSTPSYVSMLQHVFGCDPVIVDKDFAFSTIRGGTACRTTNISAINVYDVKNPAQSQIVRSMNLDEPYGLGIKEDLVFVCQGTKGLFVYNWDINAKNLSLRHSYPEIHAFDVIVNGNILIVTADNGLFQFDISSKDNITYLSKLADF